MNYWLNYLTTFLYKSSEIALFLRVKKRCACGSPGKYFIIVLNSMDRPEASACAIDLL